MKKKTDYQVSVGTMYKRLKAERADHERTKGRYQEILDALQVQQNGLDSEREKNFRLANENVALRRENEILKGQRALHPIRAVDPTAEVVMLMKRSMESQISATENLLDAMGELVDHVSGRKARREAALGRIDEREG